PEPRLLLVDLRGDVAELGAEVAVGEASDDVALLDGLALRDPDLLDDPLDLRSDVGVLRGQDPEFAGDLEVQTAEEEHGKRSGEERAGPDQPSDRPRPRRPLGVGRFADLDLRFPSLWPG